MMSTVAVVAAREGRRGGEDGRAVCSLSSLTLLSSFCAVILLIPPSFRFHSAEGFTSSLSVCHISIPLSLPLPYPPPPCRSLFASFSSSPLLPQAPTAPCTKVYKDTIAYMCSHK